MTSSARNFLRDFAAYAGRKGIEVAIFVFLGAVLESIGLILLIPLLGVVFGSGKGRLFEISNEVFHRLGTNTAFGRLAVLLALFGLLMVGRAAVMSVRNVMLAELRIGFVEAQRSNVARCLAAARWDQVVRLRHARITHLMSGDIQRVGQAAYFLMQGTTALVMLLAQCALAFALAPVLASMAFVLLVIGAVALIPVLRRARSLGNYVTQANLNLLNSTTQFLGGLKLAISQDLQSRFVAEFDETLHALARRQIESTQQQTNTQIAQTTLSALVAAALVLVGFGVFHVTPAVLTTLLIIIARMSGPVGQIQQGTQQLVHALPAYETVKQLEAELTVRERRDTSPQAAAQPLPDGPIVFDNVSFVHQDEEDGVRRGVEQLALSIQPGEFIGVAGPSGAGKTTFADLLVGLFAPQSGTIRIGGTLLDDGALAQWRARIGYISQDPFLFHDTVRRNLSWANPAATEAEMWDALSCFGAADLVRRMEAGLDTVVGERGTLVSGGERQRIALARALLHKPRLLVLDEATSAIDIAGEREVIERLLALSPRPTIVMIAHRPESLDRCDRILRMDNGRLEEEPRQARISAEA